MLPTGEHVVSFAEYQISGLTEGRKTDFIGNFTPAVLSPIDNMYWTGYSTDAARADYKRWTALPLAAPVSTPVVAVAAAAQ